MVGAVHFVRLAGPVVFLAGAVSLAWGFLQNQASLSLFVIFPVITATGPWAILGIILLVAGFFLAIVTWSTPMESSPSASPPTSAYPGAPPPPAASPRRWGGVIFLGPVPVVFGSDQKVTRWMLILGAVLFVALLVLTVIAVWGI
jgi:uncharacterized membrane protein